MDGARGTVSNFLLPKFGEPLLLFVPMLRSVVIGSKRISRTALRLTARVLKITEISDVDRSFRKPGGNAAKRLYIPP